MPRAKASHQGATKDSTKDSTKKVVSGRKRRADELERNNKVKLAVRLREQEPPLHHRVAALIDANYPGEIRASNAYDDRVCKRRKTSSIGMPWDDEPDNGIEKPHFSSQSGFAENRSNQAVLSIAAWVEGTTMNLGPIEAMGDFAKLPTEIRDEIFRHLLVHQWDIRVLRGWSLLFPRSRPNLQTAILSVCRVFYHEGVRILYGENTFIYLLRDLPEAHHDTNRIVQRVYESYQIPINKHGHLIRNIKIIVEANRMRLFQSRQNLPYAIQKFLPGRGLVTPAQLRTVTIELPAQTRGALKMRKDAGTRLDDVPAAEWFRSDSPVIAALTSLNCQFIRIIASDSDGNQYEAQVDRRPHFTELSADEGVSDIWARDHVMLDSRRRNAARSRGRLGSLHYWLGRLATEPHIALRDGPFQRHVSEPEHVEQLQQVPSGSSRASAAVARQRLSKSSIDDSSSDSDMSDEDLDENNLDEDDDSMFVRGADT